MPIDIQTLLQAAAPIGYTGSAGTSGNGVPYPLGTNNQVLTTNSTGTFWATPIYVQNSAPSAPFTGMLWVDTA